jgi:hypothetical protein
MNNVLVHYNAGVVVVNLEVVGLVPGFKISYQGSKFHTQVQNFISGLKISYPGSKFHTQVENFTPRLKISYPGSKLHIRVKNFITRYESEKAASQDSFVSDRKKVSVIVRVDS